MAALHSESESTYKGHLEFALQYLKLLHQESSGLLLNFFFMFWMMASPITSVDGGAGSGSWPDEMRPGEASNLQTEEAD